MKKIIALMAFCIIMAAGAVSASAAANVAALMYHSVTTDSTRWGDYTVSPEQLDADIQYFQSCGYITMTATELADALGTSPQYLNFILHGQRSGKKYIKKIEEILGINIVA